MSDHGFRTDPRIVRLDFFKPRGKWKYTEELDMTHDWDSYKAVDPAGRLFISCPDAVLNAINRNERLKRMHQSFTAVVLEPYYENPYPVMLPHTDPNAWSEGHE